MWGKVIDCMCVVCCMVVVRLLCGCWVLVVRLVVRLIGCAVGCTVGCTVN